MCTERFTLKGFFLTGWWSEKHCARVRPFWQIVALLPVFAIYIPAKAFVDLVEGRRSPALRNKEAPRGQAD